MKQVIILDVYKEGKVIINISETTEDQIYPLRTSSLIRFTTSLAKPIKDLQKISDEDLIWLVHVATTNGKPYFGSRFKVDNYVLSGN